MACSCLLSEMKVEHGKCEGVHNTCMYTESRSIQGVFKSVWSCIVVEMYNLIQGNLEITLLFLYGIVNAFI